ncbi:hypothetical protein BE221DRAFT_143039 [Ostreococcus tauri]|uniref:Uncharacterized protein n=1 Tax=Ostreococcus tauri TaxID=70448 RepID=A0A1Y5HWM8_OSTTA|nr:hypothetical protein BE221DRAFT_143039 [Ostreococcus tauri]
MRYRMSYPETKGEGFDEGNDPTAGTTQPTEGIEDLVNYFNSILEEVRELEHCSSTSTSTPSTVLEYLYVVYATAVASTGDHGGDIDASTGVVSIQNLEDF